MKKTICWVQHASEWPSFILLARSLEKKGYRSIFVCKARTAYEKYVEEGFTVYYASDFCVHGDELDGGELTRLDNLYGPPSMGSLYFSDTQLQYLCKSNRKGKQVIARAYHFWQDLIEKECVTNFIVRETATWPTRSAYNVAKQKGISYFQLTLGPGPGLTNLYDVGELHIWSALNESLAQKWSITDKQKKEVDEFVQERVPAVDCRADMVMRYVPKSPIKVLKNYLGLIKADTKKSRKYDPMYVGAIRYGRKRVLQQAIWTYVTRYFFKYDQVREGEDYVYFPTYSGLETSYLTHVPYWSQHQLDLIKEVARKLPTGVKLYVKEHPHNPGDLSLRELRKLKKISNIRIIKPQYSSQCLILKSLLTFVVQGTAGWEAFLRQKPVVCLGKTAFYSLSNLVYSAGHVDEIESKIYLALKHGSNVYAQHNDDWYDFIYSVISTSGRGDVVNLHPPYGFVTEVDEVEKVANYIHKKITSQDL